MSECKFMLLLIAVALLFVASVPTRQTHTVAAIQLRQKPVSTVRLGLTDEQYYSLPRQRVINGKLMTASTKDIRHQFCQSLNLSRFSGCEEMGFK
jgi:hypothetical protein